MNEATSKNSQLDMVTIYDRAVSISAEPTKVYVEAHSSSIFVQNTYQLPDEKFFSIKTGDRSEHDANKNIRSETMNFGSLSVHGIIAAGKNDEDRFAMIKDLVNSNFSAFGVYDGHGGVYGSKLCSDLFCASVLTEVQTRLTLLRQFSDYPYDFEHDIFDSIICEAIRKVTKYLNHEIKSKSRTGTTAVNVFIRQLSDGSHQIYCSNTGDSGCVAFYRNKTLLMSEDHKLTLPREVERIKARQTALWYSLPQEYVFTSTTLNTTSNTSSNTPLTTARSGKNDVLIKKRANACVAEKYRPSLTRLEKASKLIALLSAYEHTAHRDDSDGVKTKVLNVIESIRVDSVKRNSVVGDISSLERGDTSLESFDHGTDDDLEAKRHGAEDDMSGPASIITATASASESMDISGSARSEAGAIASEVEVTEELSSWAKLQQDHVSKVKDSGMLLHDKGSPEPYIIPYDTHLDEFNEYYVMEMKYRQSFIQSRSQTNSSCHGPNALYSRHGVSTTMTRAIGDRHAARTCVCTPEIVKMTTGPNEYARLILGSDGLWDVISNDKAVVMVKHIKDPTEACQFLTQRSRALREERGMYKDDVTCIVIDINPNNYPVHDYTCGASCTIA